MSSMIPIYKSFLTTSIRFHKKDGHNAENNINDSIITTRHLVVSTHLRYVFIFVAVLLKEKELYQIGASYLLNRKHGGERWYNEGEMKQYDEETWWGYMWKWYEEETWPWEGGWNDMKRKHGHGVGIKWYEEETWIGESESVKHGACLLEERCTW